MQLRFLSYACSFFPYARPQAREPFARPLTDDYRAQCSRGIQPHVRRCGTHAAFRGSAHQRHAGSCRSENRETVAQRRGGKPAAVRYAPEFNQLYVTRGQSLDRAQSGLIIRWERLLSIRARGRKCRNCRSRVPTHGTDLNPGDGVGADRKGSK